MTLAEFRQRVRREFGGDLRRMTPANAREFLDRMSLDCPEPIGERIRLDEREQTYEGIVRDFLLQVLELPRDKAVIQLWLYSLELTIAQVNDLERDRLHKLFATLAAEDE